MQENGSLVKQKREEKMKVKAVGSFKPGVYVRHQVVCKGMWVDVRGFLFLPVGHGSRKWWGPAMVKRVKAPQVAPMAFLKHGRDPEPQKVYYHPITGMTMEVKDKGHTLKFNSKDGGKTTFRL